MPGGVEVILKDNCNLQKTDIYIMLPILYIWLFMGLRSGV
jgi:hypothetical protein